MLFVDLDNLYGYANDINVTFSVDALVSWCTAANTGISRIAAVHVFTTVVKDVHRRWDVPILNPSNFVIHRYDRRLGEKGYPDEDIYRCAWKHVSEYDTGVFISNDKGFTEAAKRLRNGFNTYSPGKKALDNPPEFLVISAFWGLSKQQVKNSGALDLDRVLHELHLRGPVNRPIQL